MCSMNVPFGKYSTCQYLYDFIFFIIHGHGEGGGEGPRVVQPPAVGDPAHVCSSLQPVSLKCVH